MVVENLGAAGVRFRGVGSSGPGALLWLTAISDIRYEKDHPDAGGPVSGGGAGPRGRAGRSSNRRRKTTGCGRVEKIGQEGSRKALVAGPEAAGLPGHRRCYQGTADLLRRGLQTAAQAETRGRESRQRLPLRQGGRRTVDLLQRFCGQASEAAALG